MTTSRLSIDQIIAWMLIEGWSPVDEGTAAIHPDKLKFVTHDHFGTITKGGAFLQGVYDAPEFDRKKLRRIYNFIQESGL